ncbi:MAG: hypothetical protein canaca05_03920 [Anaerolineaceae bacterium]
MLRKHCNRWLLIVVLALMLGACIPYSFSPPKEVHIDPGDSVSQAQVAVDTEGVSHIVGVVDDRIVYYRTRYGEPIITATFTMSGSGTDWKQYSPGIAVTDSRTAYLVWIEQRGGPEKFACYRNLTYIPPIGGWTRYCNPLDGNIQTTGNVKVIARGDKAYAVYDRMYTGDSNGRIGELMYKELTNPSITGHIHWYTEYFETGFIYSLDLGIDSQGYLHVGFLDDYEDGNPFATRLFLNSNASVDADGNMSQQWFITIGITLDESIPVSLSFFNDTSDVEYVVLADGQGSTVDTIYLDYCVAVGCANQQYHRVDLPSSWDTYSAISDVEILGIDRTLYLSFIGDDYTTPNVQVYFKEAYLSSDPKQISEDLDSSKWKLEMTAVNNREPSWPLTLPATAWIESIELPFSGVYQHKYIAYDGWDVNTMVFQGTCVTSTRYGDIHSNGNYFSGVWEFCGETWFTTQAWTNQLPLIMK